MGGTKSAVNNKCVADTAECTGTELQKIDANAILGTKTWENNGWATCQISECRDGYAVYENKCYVQEKDCDPMPQGATKATQKWQGTEYSECIITECRTSYELKDNACVLSADGSV